MINVAKENLMQLKDVLQQIREKDYTAKSQILFGATIGEHIRHILEFYFLLITGSSGGVICYDKRKRDPRIESSPEFAIEIINKLISGLSTLDLDATIVLDADYTRDGSSENQIDSSVGRELAYCIEHSIHHQAIIKSGLIALGLTELTNEYFGVAYSTIRYRKDSCAQ